MTEQELHSWLKKMAAGDQQAFQKVYEQISQPIYRTVYFLISNKQDVHDVVSEEDLEKV